MKSLLFIVAFCGLCFSSALAQSKKELKTSLSRDLATYQRVTQRMNYDSIFYFMPPKMSDIIPADSLAATMQKAMDNEYMRMEMTGMRYGATPKIKKAGTYRWAYVDYNAGMNLHVKPNPDTAFTKMFIGMMKTQFGRDNVTEKGNNLLEIALRDKQLLAFKGANDPHWYFIEDKRQAGQSLQQRAIMDMVVPEEVLKATEKK